MVNKISKDKSVGCCFYIISKPVTDSFYFLYGIFEEMLYTEYSLEGLMWSWSSNILATWCEELTHWKRPWCWERLKAGGEMDNKGWDDWMALLTQRTWVWASSGVGDGQGSLACYSHWAAKSQTWLRDWTEQNVDQNKLQKILKEMGIADYRNCLLRTCMQVKSNS